MDNFKVIKEKKETEYKYTFGDGTSAYICTTMFKENDKRWIEILTKMDLDEAANNKKESRRHCSYEALDPDGSDLGVSNSFEETLELKDEMVAFYKCLSEREKEVYKLRFFDGLTQNETAKIVHYDRSVVSRVEAMILRKLEKFRKKFNKF